MAIIDGIKQIKQFATGANGDKQLISNWTSTSTVYDWDEIERKWVAVHDTLASDDKVAQIPTDNDDACYELLFSESNDNLEHTEGTRKSQYLVYNPDIKRLKIGNDVAIGDFNAAGTLGIQGLNGVTGIGLIKQGATWNANADCAKITYSGSGITINKSIYLVNGSTESSAQMIQFIGGAPVKHTNTINMDSITIQVGDPSVQIYKGISIDVDDINLIGSNSNGWDGTHQSLKDALGAKLNCSWTAIANSQYNYTTEASDSASWGQVITDNNSLKNANEVMVRFTNARISPIILHLDRVAEYVTFLTSEDSYKLCVGALWDKTNGKISVRCTVNGWGYTSVPVTVGASNIYYR